MRHCSLRPSGEHRPRPVERCHASVGLAVRNYVPQWCGKRGPAKYEEFRTAFAQYQAAIEGAFATEFQVSNDLPATCWGEGGFHPANAAEVDMITVRIQQFSRPAAERAATALRKMQATRQSAFEGNPDAISVGLDVDLLTGVVEAMGRGNVMLESAGEMFRNAQTEQVCHAAAYESGSWSPEYAQASVL